MTLIGNRMDLEIADLEGLPRIYADGRGSESQTSPRINTDGTDWKIG